MTEKFKILYCKCFGLGNAVMAVPAIRALAEVYGPIDLLIGTTQDDGGAMDVFSELKENYPQAVGAICHNVAPFDVQYDIAILAIPFDGRWQNGRHFVAKQVIDGRPRPGDPTVLGLEQWQKHETLYQMDNAVSFGTGRDATIFTQFAKPVETRPDLVYVGMGFKRDQGSFWSKKHWGNDNFVRFMRRAAELRPGLQFITTGGPMDLPVIGDVARQTSKLTAYYRPIRQSFEVVGSAQAFFGNDTGMAHVAASYGLPTYMMTAFKGSDVKNHPFCPRYKCNPFHTEAMSPEDVAEDFLRFVYGDA